MTSPLCWKEIRVNQTLLGEAMLPTPAPGRKKLLVLGTPSEQDGGKVTGIGDVGVMFMICYAIQMLNKEESQIFIPGQTENQKVKAIATELLIPLNESLEDGVDPGMKRL
ncbi:hypothetical protein Y1Q_0010763 [Alligator mississippiensis]|uniref:Uncharacterized protein n=1 Tax=Alligator mississippiensis TaxID=8496 RepID=A0A151M6P0_ALLMI|nr:hypothetical protein Y1Q_0010763 [Alligator mississippiensis]